MRFYINAVLLQVVSALVSISAFAGMSMTQRQQQPRQRVQIHQHQQNDDNNLIQSSVRRSISSSLLWFATASAASASDSKEEDLELTRQIILNFINDGKSPSTESTDQTDSIMDLVPESINLAGYLKRPTNDNMIRVAFGEETSTTPLWLFRQAGRHLPEYHEYKGTKSFLDLLASPVDVAECTLQPVRRYNLDAAILFSDILVILEALNIPITMPGGVGIQVPEPLQNPGEMKERLYATEMTPAEANSFVQSRLKHVLQAVSLIRTKMQQEDISIPLIGFSAAPWTLLYYMVGGTSKKNQDIGMKWLKDHSEDSQKLLDLLTVIVTEYLACQVEQGAHMLQIFEAMGMMINDELFEQYALPCLGKIGSELKKRYNKQIPIMVFTRGACSASNLQKVAALDCFDVITIDGSINRLTIRQAVGSDVTLQGCYDPAELIEANGKTVETVKETARLYLNDLGPQKLIANLGEGLGGKESPKLVDAFVNAIHEISAEMIQQQKDQKIKVPAAVASA